MYRSFTWHSNDFESQPGKHLRPHGLWVKFPYWQIQLWTHYKRFDLKIFQIGDPMGLQLNLAVSSFFFMCRASAEARHSFWNSMILVTSWDQCRNHDFEILNQSISVQCAPITRRPNIRTSYPMPGASHPSVFRVHVRHINCSQSSFCMILWRNFSI